MVEEQTRRSQNIGFLCTPGLDNFLKPVQEFLGQYHRVSSYVGGSIDAIRKIVLDNDVIWIEWANDLAVVVTNMPEVRGKRVIIRLHSYEVFVDQFLQGIDWRRVTDVVFVGKHVKNLFVERLKRLVPKDRIADFSTWYIPNAVAMDKYPFTKHRPGYNVAFIGYINDKKGPMLLIHAFAALFRKNAKYTLHVAGTAQDLRHTVYLNHMIRSMGLARNIRFYGHVEDIPKWLEDKNYIVCTSPFESQNMGLMEAMACGVKPLIHNFYGADTIYPENYLWLTINDFVRKAMNWKDYNSSFYRGFIENRYSDRILLPVLDDMLAEEPEFTEDTDPVGFSTLDKIDIAAAEFVYKPEDYWGKRSNPTDPNMSKVVNDAHVDFIRTQLPSTSEGLKILDLGPGIGRTFDAYKGAREVWGVDISANYVDRAKEKAKEVGFLYQPIQKRLEDRLPFDDMTFDVAVASEVLLHVLPGQIEATMKELARVAKKVVIISWYEGERVPYQNLAGPTTPTTHCFHYNYIDLCAKNGWVMDTVEYTDNQIMFSYYPLEASAEAVN